MPSGSPPYKRVSCTTRNTVLDVSKVTASDSSSSSISSGSMVLSAMNPNVRDAHLQFHDRLRELRRDFQFMASNFMRIRDERISASLNEVSSFTTESVKASAAPVVTSTLLEPDLDFDLSEYAALPVTHE